MFSFKNILEFNKKFSTELKCEKFLIKQRWEDGKIRCPYCNSLKHCKTKEKRFKCGECKASFTIKVGTIFEGSKMSLRKWFYAIYLLTSNSKGISSVELAQKLSTTQKTSWFMLQRLRFMIEQNANKTPFNSTTEIDETYIGGKEENKHKHKKFTKQKDIVIGMVNRENKEVRASKVASSKYYDLAEKVFDNVEIGNHIITDELSSYRMLKLYYKHDKINHSVKEYVRENIHTNTIEGFFSLLKRTVLGTYHFVSSKHLNKYLNEITYRYNNKASASMKFIDFTSNLVGRLRYRELIG